MTPSSPSPSAFDIWRHKQSAHKLLPTSRTSSPHFRHRLYRSITSSRSRSRKVSPRDLLLAISVATSLILALRAIIAALFISHDEFFTPPGQPPRIAAYNTSIDAPFQLGCADPEVAAAAHPRANAAIVVLARNSELDGVVDSMRSLERHFNRWFKYPYVFLNNGEFSPRFKSAVRQFASGDVEFGYVNASLWDFPSWASRDVYQEGIKQQGDQGVMYGGLESYHHMCRFYSGMFYRHELLDKYKWYWRLEPDVKYFCDITYDPFVMMEKHGKRYGFTIAIKELVETVPNIFRYASAFKRTRNIKSKGMWEMFLDTPAEKEKKHEKALKRIARNAVRVSGPEDVLHVRKEQSALDFIAPYDMNGESYNMCHFWSNFEIADLDFFRSAEYTDFFDYMDRSGGFWMERWGDAPIHSLAAGILLDKHQVHYFRDIGYRHTTIQHCPANAPDRQLPHEHWEEKSITNTRMQRQTDRYWSRPDRTMKNGAGCRCRCDPELPEIEVCDGSCIPQWVRTIGGYVDDEDEK